jgi:hypothetical protein
MAELKTKQTEASVQTFLESVADVRRRADAQCLLELMQETTGQTPRMWGPSMVGFGERHYVYASGHEGDIFQVGFAPRKDALVLYGLLGNEQRETLLPKLGKVKTGKGCLYVKRLDEINLPVLRALIQAALLPLPPACGCATEDTIPERQEPPAPARTKPKARKAARKKP